MWMCKANYLKIVKTHTHTDVCAGVQFNYMHDVHMCVYTLALIHTNYWSNTFALRVFQWECECVLVCSFFLFAPFLSHFPLCRRNHNHLKSLLLANYLTRLYKPLILSFKHENQHQKIHFHCSFFLNYNFFLFWKSLWSIFNFIIIKCDSVNSIGIKRGNSNER